MKVQAVGFSRNGQHDLVGILKVTDDEGDPLGLQHKGNYSDLKVKNFFVKTIIEELGIDDDRAKAAVTQALRTVDKELAGQGALPGEDDIKKNQATKLVDLAEDLDLWHNPDGTPYVTYKVDGHYETCGTHAKPFRILLSYRFYQVEGKSPGSQAIQDALGTLDGKAIFEGEEHQVFIRAAEVEGAIHLDLVNDARQQVKITAEGWEVVDDSPIRFRRSFGMQPLPIPIKGGNFTLLRGLLNIPDGESGDYEWSLIAAWLVQALRGQGPYPIAVIQGEQGSAKSSESKVLRRLIDPNKADLRVPPKEERDIMIQASNGLVIAYDNLSNVPEWLANSLCRLSTGGGMGIRELYSDGEEKIFEGQGPVILNGIEELSNRPDLMDRSIIFIKRAIAPQDRKTDRQFRRDFAAAHPEILGGLLNGVVEGLKNVGSVHLESLPRMADFAIWATACETGLGFEAGTFLAAYEANREQANEATLEASIVAAYIQQFVEREGDWTGTFTDLLFEIDLIADEKHKKHKSWPTRPNVLSSRIRALAPNLRAAGVEVTQGRAAGKSRIRIQIIKGENSCVSCGQTVREVEIFRYVDDGVICQKCGDVE